MIASSDPNHVQLKCYLDVVLQNYKNYHWKINLDAHFQYIEF